MVHKVCFPGELTPEQAELYGYVFAVCNFCGSDALVVAQYVNDVVCEDCGRWQKDD